MLQAERLFLMALSSSSSSSTLFSLIYFVTSVVVVVVVVKVLPFTLVVHISYHENTYCRSSPNLLYVVKLCCRCCPLYI